MIDPIRSALPPLPAVVPPDRLESLRRLADQMEAAFLSEMLGYAGLDAAATGFCGGAGEAQFASFLRDEQAKAMVKAGGIGLAESLFRAMAGRQE